MVHNGSDGPSDFVATIEVEPDAAGVLTLRVASLHHVEESIMPDPFTPGWWRDEHTITDPVVLWKHLGPPTAEEMEAASADAFTAIEFARCYGDRYPELVDA